MRMFEQVGSLRTYLRGIREEGKTVGFVPTLGALHEGHLTLFRRAKNDCDIAVASIFVNPTQFNEHTDFEAYPRDLMKDQRMASQEGMDALFVPSVEEMYPSGFQTSVHVSQLSATLEGAHRPGHFEGVATVVAKLLNIVQPDHAYFGQKDYQQFLIIERMARDLNLPTEIVIAPTMREADGLAMSSRNAHLSPEERKAATVLYRALQRAETLVKENARSPERTLREMEALIAEEPLARSEYVALVHPDTLEPMRDLAEGVTLAALAVRIGRTRLIDNALIVPAGIAPPKNRRSKR